MTVEAGQVVAGRKQVAALRERADRYRIDPEQVGPFSRGEGRLRLIVELGKRYATNFQGNAGRVRQCLNVVVPGRLFPVFDASTAHMETVCSCAPTLRCGRWMVAAVAAIPPVAFNNERRLMPCCDVFMSISS